MSTCFREKVDISGGAYYTDNVTIRTTVQKTMFLTCKHENPLFLHSGPE